MPNFTRLDTLHESKQQEIENKKIIIYSYGLQSIYLMNQKSLDKNGAFNSNSIGKWIRKCLNF